MAISLGLMRLLASRLPIVLKTALLNILGLSPTEGKQDLRLEVSVSFIRSFMDFSASSLKIQKDSLRDPGKKGYMWAPAVTMPKPAEDDVLQHLLKAIEAHMDGSETYDIPKIHDVEAEWSGYRKGARESDPLPDLSDEATYERLMEDVDNDMTILYLHGGAYHLMDPCTHRITTVKLAKMTGGRCFSVRYRLAPQNPFPAGLLDALVAYLSLLSPPPGSFHTPVPADKIVISGDSAGGGLSLALLQTLLTIRRLSSTPTIRFHGKDVPIELPAGIAVASPFADVTRSLPSTYLNAKWDYIIPPPQIPGQLYTPYPFPPDETWPTNPPRLEFYANANMLAHPLVSPVAGPSEIWKDTPPIYMNVAQECLQDEGLHLARNMYRAGGTVVLEHYEGKPHCFMFVTPASVAGKLAFKNWASFCVGAVQKNVQRTDTAAFWDYTTQHIERRPLDDPSLLSEEEVRKRVFAGKDWRVEGEVELLQQWNQGLNKAKL